MNRHQHPTNNDVLRAPPGMTPEQCMPLAITRVQFADQQRAVISYWKPDARELKLLVQGAPLRLLVMGDTHPPLLPGVSGDGFGQINGEEL